MWRFELPRIEHGATVSLTKTFEEGGVLQLVAARVNADDLQSVNGVELSFELNRQWRLFTRYWLPAELFAECGPNRSPPLRFNLLLMAGDCVTVRARTRADCPPRSPVVDLLTAEEVEPCPLCADLSQMTTQLAKHGLQRCLGS